MVHSEKRSIRGKCRCEECVEGLRDLMEELPLNNPARNFIDKEMLTRKGD